MKRPMVALLFSWDTGTLALSVSRAWHKPNVHELLDSLAQSELMFGCLCVVAGVSAVYLLLNRILPALLWGICQPPESVA